MDEAEKYQQRLQAIAEKRRLQEEQDRAKRQQEDEKLRLQQMKRKSLREQWLMEGPLLSPDGAGPRSPLWGPQAQQVEANFDKLQSEIAEKPHKHKEDGSTSAQSHTDHHGNSEGVSAVTPPSGSSANREVKSTDPLHGAFLSNGTTQDKKIHNAPLQHVNDISRGVETLLFLGYTEAEPGQGLSDADNEDDVSAVIRAERVIITEDGEEVNETLLDTHAEEEDEEEQEKVREKGQEEKEEEINEEQEKERKEELDKEQEEENAVDVENHVEMSTEADEVTELEEGLRHNNGDANTDINQSNEDMKVKMITPTDEETSANDNAGADTKPEEDTKSELNTDLTPDAVPAAASAQENTEKHLQPLSETPGCATQTPSVSNTVLASALNPNGAQKSLGPALSTTKAAAQFQEIPLDGGVVEEEPLLAAKVEPLTDASALNQTDQAKTKTCQCCSVM